jgi:hypothetical protein
VGCSLAAHIDTGAASLNRQSRAIERPPVPQATIRWHAPLFNMDDVLRIAERVTAEDGKLAIEDGVDPELIASGLNRADRDVRRLLTTLGMTAEQCMDMAMPLADDLALPAIYHLREAARVMPGRFWPPVELADGLADRGRPPGSSRPADSSHHQPT